MDWVGSLPVLRRRLLALFLLPQCPRLCRQSTKTSSLLSRISNPPTGLAVWFLAPPSVPPSPLPLHKRAIESAFSPPSRTSTQHMGSLASLPASICSMRLLTIYHGVPAMLCSVLSRRYLGLRWGRQHFSYRLPRQWLTTSSCRFGLAEERILIALRSAFRILRVTGTGSQVS
jgi:hypothetical protein